MSLNDEIKEAMRHALCAMQLHTLQAIQKERIIRSADSLRSISEETAADVIYAIDVIAEKTILYWFDANWFEEWPVEIIMEGLEGPNAVCFPRGTKVKDTKLKCIIDPIDGTRGIMHDKRSAWILTGIAPQKGSSSSLADIEIAAMTEIPTTRQWRADQISVVRGNGNRATAFDVRNDYRPTSIELLPSTANDVLHAFGTISRFFPAGSVLLSRIEESLWQELYSDSATGTPVVFNDQYISTGGQFYELLSGHDRFIADLRPSVFQKLNIETNLCAHPYDVACVLILQEAGCIIEHADGSPLNAPLDTTSPVEWIAYANERIAQHIRPALQKSIQFVLS